MTVKSTLVFALSTFLTAVSAVPYYPSSGPIINPQTTIAPQTDFIPITNVQPVVNVLPTDYNDYSWWGPLYNAYPGGWGGAGSGAWSGGLAAARGEREAWQRGEELVDGTGERKEGLLSDMERFEYDPFLSGTLVSIVPPPPVVVYLICVLSFSLGRFLS